MTFGDDGSKTSTSRGQRQRGSNEYALDSVLMMRRGNNMKMLSEFND